MLSRVANRVYWMSRYIERVENTARLVNTYHFLLLDMPRGTTVGWHVLPYIAGSFSLFDEIYTRHDERNTVKFMLADKANPGSLLNTVSMARENVRTSREELPGDCWEQVNELYIFVRDHVGEALTRRGRFAFLIEIIQRCQQITGLLAGTMSHDTAYDFIRLGRNIERADMTTRVIDIGAVSMKSDDGAPQEYHVWTSILRATSAYQMYRKDVQLGVHCADVVNYLLKNSKLPRSVAQCLDQVEECITVLPYYKNSLDAVRKVDKRIDRINPKKLDADSLHAGLDRIQKGISSIDRLIGETWFV